MLRHFLVADERNPDPLRSAALGPRLAAVSLGAALAAVAVPSSAALAQGDGASPSTASSASSAVERPETPRRGTVPHVPGRAVLHVVLEPGERIVAGTTGLAGARHEGDTTLGLRDARGHQVAFDDDAGLGLGSRLVYDVPPDAPAGTYAVVSGCYHGTGCGGVVAYEVSPTPPAPAPVRVRWAMAARGWLALDGAGAGGTADATFEWRPVPEVGLRLGGVPLGVGGGRHGGIAGGSLHVSAAFAPGEGLEVGVGTGVAVLASRIRDEPAQELPVFVARARAGSLLGFHVEAQLALAEVQGGVELVSLTALARLPLSGVDLMLRGAGGHDGVMLAEAVLLVWLASAGERGVFGLGVHAGASGVFYQPLCRFGTACAETRWYAGPMLGVGMEWRP
jgi:hypothetical protein